MPERICSIDGCAKPAQGRGWCKTHWARWSRHGDPLYERATSTACVVDGCDQAPRSRYASHCETHYYRLRRTGTTDRLPQVRSHAPRERKARAPLPRKPWVAGYCAHCGESYVTKGRDRYCSRRCKGRHDAQNYSRRQRRAPNREAVTLQYIAARDDWRCHLCGKKVDPSYEGAHSLSPSLDHLVPLFLGGEHTRANIKLAHRGCNCRKRTRAMDEQLLLIG